MTIDEEDKALLESGRVQELRGDNDETLVPTYFRIFQPGRRAYTMVRHDMKKIPGYAMLDSVIGPLLGLDVENMEHVAVLYEKRPHDMFVDEMGARSTIDRRAPKPVNEKATEIYQTYSRDKGMDMTDAPRIHGVAVIVMRKVWY